MSNTDVPLADVDVMEGEQAQEEQAQITLTDSQTGSQVDEKIEPFEHGPPKKSIVVIPNKFEEYKAECLKYMIAPLSMMSNIGEITQLNLECMKLSDLHIRIILQHLIDYKFIQFTHINLSKNPLSPKTCEVLAEYIFPNETLSHLNLNECLIGLEGVEMLADCLSYSASLKYINLSKCELNDEGGVIVVEAMQINDECKILDLSYNKLSSQTAALLEVLLEEKQTLEKLYLNYNHFYQEQESIVPILKGLSKNQSLREVDLAWNGMTGPLFTKFFYRAMKGCETLEKLNLDFNLLKGEDILGIVKAIPLSKSLKSLSLKGNPLSRDDVLILLSLFETPISLKTLDLGKEFWHRNDFFTKISEIMELNPGLHIIYQSKCIKKNPTPVNMKQIIIDRIKFLSNKAMINKKKAKRWDFDDVIHDFTDQIKEEGDLVLPKPKFIQLIKDKRITLPEDTLKDLSDTFTRIISSEDAKKKPKPLVDVKYLSEYYLNRFKIPPRVIVEVVEEPKKESKPKGKKGGKKAK